MASLQSLKWAAQWKCSTPQVALLSRPRRLPYSQSTVGSSRQEASGPRCFHRASACAPGQSRQPASKRQKRFNSSASIASDDDAATGRSSSAISSSASSAPTEPKQYHILQLRNASPSLTAGDFHILEPRGKHIEDWNIRGKIQNVIPVRDRKTFQRNGTYNLIFDTERAALNYRDHVGRIYKYARDHTPRGLLSPLNLPPSRTPDGEDMQFLIRRFSLVPLWQQLDLRLRAGPHDENLRGLVANSGYVALGKKDAHKVMLRFEGITPHPRVIEALVRRHGKEVHGLPWNVSSKASFAYSVPSANQSVGDAAARKVGKGENEEDRASGPRVRSKEGGARDGTSKLPRPMVVTFATLAEAQRFARSWHRKRSKDERGQMVMMTAEVVV